MLKICICDDMQNQLETAQKLTAEYIRETDIEAETEAFSHPDQLLSALETKSFHIYLLDMVMPMVNGIDVGKAVRKTDPFAQIIYITSAPEYVLDSFAANPIDYIIKPVAKQKLFLALNNAIQKIDLSLEKAITVKTKIGIYTVPVSRIVCLEYVRHSVLYTLSDGKKLQTATLKESFGEHAQNLLQNQRFVQPHSSYIVNMQYVERLNKDGFQMKGDCLVPISGKKYVEVRDRYLNFRLGV